MQFILIVKPTINLEDLTIGNGISDPIHQLKYGEYLYHLGLFHRNASKEMQIKEQQSIGCIKNKNFTCAFNEYLSLFNSY